MKILKQLSKRKIVDDVILVPIGDTSLKLKGLITLNETGEFLWDRLPDAKDAAELAAELAAEYEVDLKDALADVESFLSGLRELEII